VALLGGLILPHDTVFYAAACHFSLKEVFFSGFFTLVQFMPLSLQKL
jgi:hypothetical protein